jgi:hypothetical protein
MTTVPDSPPLADRQYHAWNVRDPAPTPRRCPLVDWTAEHAWPGSAAASADLTRPAVINPAAFPEGVST